MKNLHPALALSRADLADYIKHRDSSIIEAFKVNPSPTETVRALGNIYSREVVRRVATRAGLWDATRREASQIKRTKNVDYTKSAYNKHSKSYPNETQFQKELGLMIAGLGIAFEAEVQVPGFQGRADFVGADFVIEAKNTVCNEDICRGLGQCIVYRDCFPGKRVALVYPDDLEHRASFSSVFANNGLSIMPVSHLAKWLL
jgi:hypothetical protein